MTLTIAVPTWNRAPKLRRMLTLLAEHIAADGLAHRVQFLINDNASTDETPAVLSEFKASHPLLTVRTNREPANVGVVRSMWWLFRNCATEYCWFFCDDDIPFPSAVSTILRALDAHRPRALLFSFQQPPGSSERTFDHPEPVTLLSDPRRMINAVARWPKISLYVYRRAAGFSEAASAPIETALREHGYLHAVLVLSLLLDDPAGQVALISEQLARSDDDYRVVRTPVTDWGTYHDIFRHPFVLAHAPDVAAAHGPEQSYLAHLGILWSWRAGALEIDPSHLAEYERALAELPVRWSWLARRPGMLLRALLLKFAPGSLPRAANRAAAALRRSAPKT